MPSLDHHSHAPPEHRDAVVERHNARLGLALFAVYLIGYAGYVAVSAFAPKRMDELIGGLNVAVVSGFGLIGGAVVLAVVYSFLCRTPTAGGRS
jgi:uncharacterized membrane protein (DUF485 family)